MADLESVEVEAAELFTHIAVSCPNEKCGGLLDEEIEGDHTDDLDEEIRCQYCQTLFRAVQS